MNVVIRGLMAAGMGIYASIHIQQAFSPPDDAPTWLAFMFGLTAVVAVVIAAMLILVPVERETRWEISAGVLAAGSALALLLALTVGFLGVTETSINAETAMVLVAESVVLIALVIKRVASPEADEDDRDHVGFRDQAEARTPTADRDG